MTHDGGQDEPIDARFRQLFETAPDAMVIVDEHGLIEFVNAQTEELFPAGHRGLRRDPRHSRAQGDRGRSEARFGGRAGSPCASAIRERPRAASSRRSGT
ncbi:PAS domain-containing protein [Polyangium jinanense]|uniref:PAS domain-containing protein n=1 Tax=Polyangium jinanense TaxID=2829994 RepID=A0A9X4AYQ8_9BACT|nr:PAS domain-containing protein [Polyangium jinanense]MDC3987367.1 PAS domain-containing protein [Polyangium jinanense]